MSAGNGHGHKGRGDGGGRRRTGRPSPARGSRGQTEVLLGPRAALEALRAGRRAFHELWLREGREAPAELFEAAQARGCHPRVLPRREFDERAGGERPHQGIALVAGPLPTLTLQEIPEAFGSASVLVALDGVEDPQNLGAISRVALAAGAQGLILTARRSAPLGEGASRASAGALEHLPVAVVPNLREAIRRLAALGFTSVAADPTGEVDLYQSPPIEGPRILVLGGEGKGLRPLLRNSLDHRVRIPIADAIQSLNVATAAAVVLFEWRRQGAVG